VESHGGVVVDLGCCEHDGESSIDRLLVRHQPAFFYGFDPLLEEDATYVEGPTTVRLEKKAAWIANGEGKLGVGARTLLDATVIEDKNDHGEWGKTVPVRFFNLGDWMIKHLNLKHQAVFKINAEGAEFDLLEDISSRGLDLYISLFYVAWHDERMGAGYTVRRRALEKDLCCEIVPWTLW
jgi:hypothetical protein